jgi:hypothetical protein
MRRTNVTVPLAVLAGSATAATAAAELLRIRRRQHTALPEAARETVDVVRAGYQTGSANETALLNLFLSFTGTFAVARGITHLIRTGRGPFVNVNIGRRHIHHFVPGILLALLSGGASIAVRHEQLDTWLALPFGTGAALILDETALLIELNDVYWSDEGVLSIDVGLGATGLLASLALITRLLRRGERVVLDHPSALVS